MSQICLSAPTNKNKTFPYEQYYLGDRDRVRRRNGEGQNCWTGAESLESYSGRFLRDTMHGVGEYRWRYKGADGIFATYEGHFYGNNIHGYGQMSYADGRLFKGHFYNNVRWGPGIESQVYLREDVGLWNGSQLIRLAWKPSTPTVAIDLMANSIGQLCVESHRIIMASNVKKMGKVNSAFELLKQYGCKPLSAIEKWPKLYPQRCTDIQSPLCHKEAFEHDYYEGKISTLEEVTNLSQVILDDEISNESIVDKGFYFSWNNNPNIIHMMKNCFKNEMQKKGLVLDLVSILSGPRTNFKPAGKHELDCRTLLMASYLGHITSVVQLVNEDQVNANVTDVEGNSTIMYAACGDQTDTIHFLVEAGANIDEFNDACCTPLAVVLLRYACLVHDIPPNAMMQAIVPPLKIPGSSPSEQKIFEWNISRDVSSAITPSGLTRTASKTIKTNLKPTPVKEDPRQVKKQDLYNNTTFKSDIKASQSIELFPEENRIFYNIQSEYNIRVNALFVPPSGIQSIPYLFEVNDMNKDIDSSEVDQKKTQQKKPKQEVASRTVKDTVKQSHELVGQGSEININVSIDSAQKLKIDLLSRAMLTILQLLKDGANPRLVRCPQPAILIATITGSSDLVRHLVNFGADVNEAYPQIYNYTTLDVAISRTFTHENLELIKTLLECGAKTQHRLKYGDSYPQDPNIPEILGPTLLHAVLARKLDDDSDEEAANIRREVLELLLKYQCDPMKQFKGRSAVDVALSMNTNVIDIFIKSPRTNLNAIINENNQTILCKIFTTPFCKSLALEDKLQMVTNLLLFGADPFIECQNEEIKYKNLFVYAKKTLVDVETSQMKPTTPAKPVSKAKKSPPLKNDEKLTSKSPNKQAVDDVGDYKQILDLATDCARLLYIRWLQGVLVRDLIQIVHKYNYRHWNMILREHKDRRATALWITAPRCLEIWDILKNTNRKMYSDRRTLKFTLYIVQYYFRNPEECSSNNYISAQEKAWVENDVNLLLSDQKLESPEMTLARPYVMPEIATSIKVNKKFDICFECMMPFEYDKIECSFCKLVAFCSQECIITNADRNNCHPCRELIKANFPSLEKSQENLVIA